MPVQHVIHRYDPRHDDHLPQPFLVAMMRSPAPIRTPNHAAWRSEAEPHWYCNGTYMIREGSLSARWWIWSRPSWTGARADRGPFRACRGAVTGAGVCVGPGTRRSPRPLRVTRSTSSASGWSLRAIGTSRLPGWAILGSKQ